MADFDFGEFLRTKRIQDAVNAHDPSYNPDDATHWLSAAHNIASPGSQSSLDTQSSIQFPQFTPDAAQSIGPVQPQENNAQPKSESQISPMGPEESKYREMLGQTPLRSQDKSGMLRKVLGGVAGIGSGIHTSDPRVGSEVTESVTHAPYYQKLQGFNQGLAIQQIKSQAETGDVASAAKNQELVARRNAEEARAEAENARKQDFVYRSSEQAHQRKLEELAVQHPGSSVFIEARYKDGTLHYLKRDDATGRLVDTEKPGTPVNADAIDVMSDPNKSLKQSQDEKIPASLQASIKAREIVADPKKAGTPEFEAAQEYIKNLSQGKDPKQAFDAVKDKTNEERRAKGQSEMNSRELETLAKRLQPDQKFGTLMVNPVNNQVLNPKPGQVLPPGARTLSGESSMNTPTTATRGRAEQAATVISTGNDLKSYIDKHKDKLGKIGDYWQQLVSGTPIADPDIAEFQTMIASYAALQAAAHGFRGSNVMKDFEQKLGGPARNPEAIKRAIDGIAKTMGEIQKSGGGSVSAPGSNNLKDISTDELLKRLAQ